MSGSPTYKPLRIAAALFRRDVTLAFRSGGGWFYALFFFAVFTALAAFAFGPSMSALANAAPATIWLAAALAVQFSAADLFEGDMRDGALKVFAAEQESLFPYWLAKTGVMAATAGLPMIFSAPLFLTMLGIGFTDGVTVAALLALGMPALMFIAVLTSALGAGLRAGGMLATIIAAPFTAPPLIFGVMATKSLLSSGAFVSPETLILAALSLFMAAMTPLFAIVALRAALD